jgi:hypothetical protein
MERYKPNKPTAKKYSAWHAPTIKNVCKLESRIERLQEECEKIRSRFSDAPELAALYAEMNGLIPLLFMPRPAGKPCLVVDNTRTQRELIVASKMGGALSRPTGDRRRPFAPEACGGGALSRPRKL